MGLLDKFFHGKNVDVFEPKKDTSQYIHDSVESILLVLENLSLMKQEQIISRIETKESYDETILSRLNIQSPSNIDYLEKYYGKSKFGYGSVKIEQLRERLNEVASEKLLAGISEEKVLDSLITTIEPEIVAYAGILIRFNASLRQVEESTNDYSTLTNQIEYWKNYYKEHELGYPVPIEKRIEEMVQELKNLPYGGYGEDEIRQFVDASKKMAEEARLNQEESSHTLSRITSDLFNPKKNRYLADVSNLKRKLQMIDESPYLSEMEKERNKQKLIKEFAVMNGHKQGLNSYVEQLQQNLMHLEFGGYGEDVLSQFRRRAETMISDGQRIVKPEDEVKKDIQGEYQRLVNRYQEKLQKLREQINVVDQMTIPNSQKDQKKAFLLEDFHDEMGLPIDFNERLNSMISELKGLEHGGYGEICIEEFKAKSFERLDTSANRVEIRDALREIRELEERLVSNYLEDLRKLYDASDRIRHDRHLDSEEKQRAIEELDREFKFKMGYRMNFDKYIDNCADELATLPGGGYGTEAVDEFREMSQMIVKGAGEEKEKYDKIRHRFTIYKKQYDLHLRTFKEWKRLQMKNFPREQRDTFEKGLNIKISYMLSLSPSALRDYYLEDERKKKEDMSQHNYVAAFKFIARREAKHQSDDSVYEKRLKELEMGQSPYTTEEIEEAIAELEILSLSGDELQEDERIISLAEFIDSTLLRQMMYIEASLLKDYYL